MAQPADALLERTRAACLERAREGRRALMAARGADDPAIHAVLRELHAIKGEAAMGGLRSIASLAHALEALVIRRRAEVPFYVDDAAEALRVLADVLTGTPADALNEAPDIADLITEVEAAGGAPADASARSPAGVPAREGDGGATMEAKARPREEAGGRETPTARGFLRVEARSIDELSRLIAEITTDLDGARNLLAGLPREGRARDERRTVEALAEQLDAVRSRVAHLEERAWSLRLLTIAGSLQELSDHAESLARQLGKKVRVEVDAGSVALERGVVEALREPLLHLVRNAVDHGVERPEHRGEKPATGRILLRAESLGSENLVVVEDDGAGLDVEAIRRRAVELDLIAADRARILARDEVLDLVFLAGFSQRAEASELSGRGVGLAAVRRSLDVLGGAVRIGVPAGGGARFELVLPAAVARDRALVFESGGLCWAIPARWVRLVVRDREAIATARKSRALRTPGGVVPARPLNVWLGAPREDDEAAIVVDIAGRSAALLLGCVPREVDLLRTPADPLLATATRLSATAILSDGRVAFFPRWAEVLREITLLAGDEAAPAPRPGARAPRVLVVDDSAVIRDIVGEVLAGAGVETLTAADGSAALELIQGQELDLVISDVEMPKMDGFELLRAIRRRSAVLPVIILTTRSKPEHRREAALLGANAYVAKSEFRGDTLLDVVRRFVDVRR